MVKPESYYDWEMTFKKKKVKKAQKVSLINSIGLSHDLFKNYIKLWKSHNMEEQKSNPIFTD